MTRSLPRKSASVRGCPVWSTSANGPPTGLRFHIRASMSSAAERSAETPCPAQVRREPIPSAARHRRKPLLSFIRHHPTRSDAEPNAAARSRYEELVRHPLPDRLDEVVAAAVHGDDHVGLELLELRDDLVKVIGGGWAEM